MYISWKDRSGRGRFNPTVSYNFLELALSQVYKITGVKMCSLRGYQPDEERVQEMVKLLTSGAAYFSWSHQGPSHTIDLTMAAQKVHRCRKLTECNYRFAIFVLFRFPDQSDNRFFWNRMLYLPYVRAGVSTSDWLIKVHSCLYKKLLHTNPIKVKPVIKTLKVMFGSVEIRTVYVGAKQVIVRHFFKDIFMLQILG